MTLLFYLPSDMTLFVRTVPFDLADMRSDIPTPFPMPAAVLFQPMNVCCFPSSDDDEYTLLNESKSSSRFIEMDLT